MGKSAARTGRDDFVSRRTLAAGAALATHRCNDVVSDALIERGSDRMKMKTLGRRAFLQLSLCFALACFALTATPAFTQNGGELRFCLHSEPKTFDPALVDDDSSLSVRYLTGGVLVRINRHTQNLEPELAESWTVSKDGRS